MVIIILVNSMKIKDSYTSLVLMDAKRELIYKIVTSIFIRGLLLIIPVFSKRVSASLKAMRRNDVVVRNRVTKIVDIG